MIIIKILTVLSLIVPAWAGRRANETERAGEEAFNKFKTNTQHEITEARAALSAIAKTLDQTIRITQEARLLRLIKVDTQRLRQQERNWVELYWQTFRQDEEQLRHAAFLMAEARHNEIVLLSSKDPSSLPHHEQALLHAISQKNLVFEMFVKQILLISSRTHQLYDELRRQGNFVQKVGEISSLRIYVGRALRELAINERFIKESPLFAIGCSEFLRTRSSIWRTD